MLASCTSSPALISTLHRLPEVTSRARGAGVRGLVRRADLQLLKRGFDMAVAVSQEMRGTLADSQILQLARDKGLRREGHRALYQERMARTLGVRQAWPARTLLAYAQINNDAHSPPTSRSENPDRFG